MYRSILVPLDGSEFSEHALPAAITVAQQSQATVHIVHVHIPQYVIIPGAVPVVDTTADQQQYDQEKAYLERVARQLGDKDVHTVTTLLYGSTTQVLCEYVTEHAIDLAIITTHGRGAFGRLWFGSTADQLVRTLPAPILLIHPGENTAADAPFKPLLHILIPLDDSPLSESVIEHALDLGALSQARYTLLHVVEQLPPEERNQIYTSALSEEGIAAAEHAAAGYLDRVAGRLCDLVPHMRIAVKVGRPNDVIQTYAAEHNVDLVAMATHGRSGFVRWYLGSVATSVMRSGTWPMLLYRLHKPRSEQKTTAAIEKKEA